MITDAMRTYSTARGYVQSMYLLSANPLRMAGLPDDTTIILSFHMLAGFATELYLKAVLTHTGHSQSELKSAAVRHDLNKLLELAEADGFSDPGAILLASALHEQHKSFEYRYMKDGSDYTVKHPVAIFNAFRTLDVAVDSLVGARATKTSQQDDPDGWTLPEEMGMWRLP